MSKLEQWAGGSMEVCPPKRFTWPALMIFSAYGFLLLLPAVFAMLMVSTLPFTTWTYVIPLVALAFATFLLPFGFGNGYAGRVARSFKPEALSGCEPVLMQVTFSPRIRSGLRSLLEDADDIGWLSWTDSELKFQGDSISFSIPLNAVRSLRLQNGGVRALFLYSRICVETSNASSKFWLAERSSMFLPESRAAARKVFGGLSRSLAGARAAAKQDTPGGLS